MKFFATGLTIAILLFVIGALSPFRDFFASIAAVIGIVCLLISALASGALVSGDRNRANFATEDKKSRNERTGMMSRLFLLGLPNFVAFIALLWIA
ncbi:MULTISPECIES: DUF5316 domain-containing protein [Sporolactobacillus]|uniref:DUF5316 domain-containing protein n=2 Tax=Sporolactobacillus TaxID=2077 RepID=A0A4Y1ZAK7_9BACL|nr:MULTISPECIES: DUF5316 domain-containing protein [Sporolactobacillus]QAA21400.1 hypothetical protein C0674_01440 [Sporolactobacillus terrae]QAA24372.1 hypothetical protein C0679_01420 [Sporolactobacillus terrae]UAK16192.1 DUF5316 domain-containing protein [Sporolactobacillus terrae]GAY76102.1 hypothetical protein NBRC111894_1656 [Sporolactobacillus inulinus]